MHSLYIRILKKEDNTINTRIYLLLLNFILKQRKFNTPISNNITGGWSVIKEEQYQGITILTYIRINIVNSICISNCNRINAIFSKYKLEFIVL